MNTKSWIIALMITGTILSSPQLIQNEGCEWASDIDASEPTDIPVKPEVGIPSITSDITGYFVENLGQKGSGGGNYYIEGYPMSAAFESGWVTFTLVGESDNGSVAYRMVFHGSKSVRPEGRDALEHRSNYLIGDRSEWVQEARNFRQVYYTNLWDNIDLRFYVDLGRLKYDLLIMPGAHIEDVSFEYVGAVAVESDVETGDLLLHTPAGSIREVAPVAWQALEAGRTTVVVRFDVAGMVVGFVVGEYDENLPLIIDPGIMYSTFLGAGGNGDIFYSSVDDEGSVYCTGIARTAEFPTTPGAYNRTFDGAYKAFVLKFSSDLSRLVYSTLIGGSDREYARAIDVDAEGNAHITGETSSTDFPTTENAWCTKKHGGMDAFFLKLDANGSNLLYSTFIAGYNMGGASEIGRVVKVDEDGLTYVAGSVGELTFPTTPGAYNSSYKGLEDIWLMKFNTSNATLIFSAIIGGTYYDIVSAIALDEKGGIIVTASTTSLDFPTTDGAFQRAHGGGSRDWVVFKLDATASTLLFSTYLGGADWDWPLDLSIDDEGNTYVCGFSKSMDFPTTPGAYQSDYNDGTEMVVCKLNDNASILQNSTFIGGSYQDDAEAMVLGPGGFVHVIGQTWSTDFPITEPDPSPADERDCVLLTLDKDLRKLVRSVRIGGNLSETVNPGLSLDDEGVFTIVGLTSSDNFPNTPGAYCTTLVGDMDDFLLKYQIDVLPPEVHPIVSGNATTGDRFEVSAFISDTTNVTEAWIEYWYDDVSEHASASMTFSNGTLNDGFWKCIIVMPANSLLPFRFKIYAQDAFGYLNTTDVIEIPVLDNDGPSLENDGMLDNVTTGILILPWVKVRDNIGVDEVRFYWYYGLNSSRIQNISMLPDDDVDLWGNGTYRKLFEVDSNTVETLHIAFAATDTSGNMNWTIWYDIAVLDDDRPWFGEDSTQGEATTGDSLTILIKVYDNIEVNSVWVSYWYGMGQQENASLLKGMDDTWHITIQIRNTNLMLQYIINANDTTGNWNRTQRREIRIVDNDPPVITAQPLSPSPPVTGGRVQVLVDVRDNIGVETVDILYGYDGADPARASMDVWSVDDNGSGIYILFVDVPIDATLIEFWFEALDTQGNPNATGPAHFQVKDDRPPTIGLVHEPDGLPIKGLALELDINVMDNIALFIINVEYRFGEGEPTSLSFRDFMDLSEASFKVSIPVPRNTSGPLRVVISATDRSDNWNTTDELSWEVVNKAPLFQGTLPTWTVVEGTEGTFDLSPFIHDLNDPLGNLTVTCDYREIRVTGMNLSVNVSVWSPDRMLGLSVSDGEATTNGSLTLRVVNVNDAPVIGSVLPVTGSHFKKGEKVPFGANATDEDGDKLTYTWYLGREVLGEGQELNYSGLEAGTHIVKLVVDDGNATTEAQITVEITKVRESSMWGLLLGVILVVIIVIIILIVGHRRRSPVLQE